MKVVRARSAGFCWGVRRAIDVAERTAAEGGGATVHTDGPLIHNRHEVARLATLGVASCKDPAALPSGSTLLVRAHGIPPERHAWLDSLGLRIVNATCPHVERIQRTCREAVREGRAVLLLGDAGHAEVIGLLGFAEGRGTVISGPDDVASLPDPGSPVALVSQSTQSEALFAATADAVRKRWPDALVANTICAATRSRQGELAELADAADALVVVGSPASANTQRLAALAGALRPTRVIDSAEELHNGDFPGARTIGLTAGASTPDSVIDAVQERLERMPPTNVTSP